jgi:hypothetical protein
MQIDHQMNNLRKGKIVVWFILIFAFLDSRREDERFWTAWYQAFPEFI